MKRPELYFTRAPDCLYNIGGGRRRVIENARKAPSVVPSEPERWTAVKRIICQTFTLQNPLGVIAAEALESPLVHEHNLGGLFYEGRCELPVIHHTGNVSRWDDTYTRYENGK